MSSPDSHQAIKNMTPPDQPDLEQIADEFIGEIRSGNNPMIADFATRYPDQASEINEFFPAIAALEGGKFNESPQGKVSLGASAPEQLGDFKIVREIGRGGMGVVYEAIQESLNRRVALKLLPRHSLLDEKQLRRFRREAELTASLHHTNIVPVFGVGENSGFHYYVMQLIEGIGLDELHQKLVETEADNQNRADHHSPTKIDSDTVLAVDDETQPQQRQQPPLAIGNEISPEFEKFVRTPRDIAKLGVQAANALQYAHDRGILHRDIKPGNLLLDRDGLLCITDFGLARVAEQSDLSKSNDMAGTLGYMAPEMFRGETCRQSDIYGLGITLYELLTSQPAIERSSRHEMIDQIQRGTIQSPRRINQTIPRDLETIIQKAIAVDTKHRYQSAGELAEDLNRFLENRPIRARRVNLLEHLWRWSKRNPAIASLSGIALSLLLMLGISLAVGFERERRERKRAESFSTLATEALDRIFNRFVPSRAQTTESNMAATDYSEPVLSRESAELLEGMVQFYEKLAESTGSQSEFQLKAANAQHKVGDIHRRLGDYDASLKAYQKSLMIYQQNAAEAEPLTIAKLLNEIGRVFWYLNDQEAANESHQKAEQILRSELAQHPDRRDIPFELARCYFQMSQRLRPGEVSHQPNPRIRPQEAPTANAKELEQAIELLEPLVQAETSRPEERFLLALCLQEQLYSQALASQTDSEKRARTLQILEDLIQDYPHVADYRHALVKFYLRIEFFDGAPGKDQKPRIESLQKAIEHANQLVTEYPTIPEYKISLIHAHNKLARTLDMMSKEDADPNEIRQFHDLAELSLRTAVKLQKELIAQYPEVPEHPRWLSKFELELAFILNRKGNQDEAKALLKDSISILETELETQPEKIDLYRDLLDGTQELSRIYQDEADDLNSILMWDKYNQYHDEYLIRFSANDRKQHQDRLPQMRNWPRHRESGPPPRESGPPPRNRQGPPNRR